MRRLDITDEERAERARQRAREWYYAHRDYAKARILTRHHAAKSLKGRPHGEAHRNWRGDRVSYKALHVWLKRNFGAESRCEHCGTTEPRRYNWANKDHGYTRKREDWMRLCIPCHRKYDWTVLGLTPPWHRKVAA